MHRRNSPQEIGHCERALGEALEWHLWVGKLPAAPAASRCTFSKCKSRSDILFRSNMRAQSLMETSPVALSPPCTMSSPLVSRSLVGLRQHAMLLSEPVRSKHVGGGKALASARALRR